MKKKTIRIIFVLTIVAIIVSLVFVISKSATQRDYINKFDVYKEDFIRINNFIMQNSSSSENSSFSITWNNEESIVTLDKFIGSSYEYKTITLDESMQKSFLNIKSIFSGTDFSFIEVTEDRISYGGLSNTMIVYSKNKKRPTYFYSPEKDAPAYHIYKMDSNWYWMQNIAR